MTDDRSSSHLPRSSAEDAPALHGRRRFLELAVVGVAGVAAACAGCSAAGGGATPAAFDDLSAGNVSALAVGSIVPVSGASACVARDDKGVYAMTLTCTHQGCDMSSRGSISDGQIVCNCHGSVFDANGGVVQGPARDPLQHFQVTKDGQGNLTVHGGSPVDASTRLPV